MNKEIFDCRMSIVDWKAGQPIGIWQRAIVNSMLLLD